ncbi:MAG TPA: nitroreductase family protein, partial [Acidimicrobiia bacterium]|nr:nitroreductase family protein [Acidimicrobiia bacterium]
MPDAYSLIRGLRATRHFQPRALDPADLAAILEAGRWTGSSKNVQGWQFVVFEDPADRER